MRDVMLIIHFLGLAMGVGTSFAFMFLGIASSKMEATEALRFRQRTLVLSKMGHIGLVLLVLSGGYLMTPYWEMLLSSPLLIAKLVLVLFLGALLGIMSAKARRAVKANSESEMKKIEPLGKLALLSSIAIVILAVLVFH